ncbi:tetratricopeptide repeat protein [Asticcacaulis sp. YBE204]|uniref:tetratricopeptide repeat protein n=1 Tax=Asticcacaulis sp. YBE204 TaxID=1282363 RepID=UPI0003C3BECC|nr:tetratricopeptide repeat protein [Asticcacaulis sp. YBE204]ESQ80344.1 hypothetical protein AEYBE204_03525 [Asticcacaulis sp. YBE204]
MSDIFEEAEEGLRNDRWTAIAKKSAPWVGGVLGGALILALGFWGYSSWQDAKVNKASELYVAAAEVAAKGDLVKAKAEFQKVVEAGAPAYKAMALSNLGAIAVEENKPDEALKLFDEAAKASPAPLISDVAALKAVYLIMDKAPYADVEKRLTPLIKDGRPFAPLAKEALAMAKIQKGDLQGARGDLQALGLSLDASDGLKQRAQIAVALIDSGGAKVAVESLKLPEMKGTPQLPTGAPSQMPAQ